jgi:hypothetical protein
LREVGVEAVEFRRLEGGAGAGEEQDGHAQAGAGLPGVVLEHHLRLREVEPPGEPRQELRVVAVEGGEAGALEAEADGDGLVRPAKVGGLLQRDAGVEGEQKGVVVGHAQRVGHQVRVPADAWVPCKPGTAHSTVIRSRLKEGRQGIQTLIGNLSITYRTLVLVLLSNTVKDVLKDVSWLSCKSLQTLSCC